MVIRVLSPQVAVVIPHVSGLHILNISVLLFPKNKFTRYSPI